MKQINRERIFAELEENLKHGDYVTGFYSGLGLPNFFVGKNTLGPEQAWVSHLLTKYLVKNPEIYYQRKVLDMGCGSGIQSIAMAKNGVYTITAADISDFAIRSTRKNIKRFNLNNIVCIKSNLFTSIESESYDVIVFNHPFLIGHPKNDRERIFIAENNTLKDFFINAKNHLIKEGVIVMPYSHLGDHNPETYIKDFDYTLFRTLDIHNKYGKQTIYLIKTH